jgi:hypothetical protein
MKQNNLRLLHQKYSEKELEENSNIFDEKNWRHISVFQTLSEDFIEKHSDKVDWDWISAYQVLSEDFIEKHSDKVSWIWISKYQKLSEEFIEKHLDKLDMCFVYMMQRLSGNFLKKYMPKEFIHLALTNMNISEETKNEILILKEII